MEHVVGAVDTEGNWLLHSLSNNALVHLKETAGELIGGSGPSSVSEANSRTAPSERPC